VVRYKLDSGLISEKVVLACEIAPSIMLVLFYEALRLNFILAEFKNYDKR
jgi:hypothetical protein